MHSPGCAIKKHPKYCAQATATDVNTFPELFTGSKVNTQRARENNLDLACKLKC